jgi:hypothetical protein
LNICHNFVRIVRTPFLFIPPPKCLCRNFLYLHQYCYETGCCWLLL